MKPGRLNGLLLLTLLFVQACWAATNAPPPTQAETLELLKLGKFAVLDHRFSTVQAAYRSGALTDEGLRAAFRVFYVTDESLAAQYDAWVKVFPKSYVAYLARGIYFKRLGAERRGAEFLNKTSSAQLHGMNAAFDQAQASLEASMSLDPKPILSYLHAMDISRSRGNGAESRALFERSLQIDPRNFIVREKYMDTLRPRWGGNLQKMAVLLAQSRAAGVAPAGLKILQTAVADERAYQLQYTEKNYSGAIAAYREAESLGGNYCRSCFGQALAHEKQYAEAVKVFDGVLLANPDDANSLGRRGNAYARLNKPVEAIADFKAAAAMGDRYAQSQLGYFYMQGVPGVLEQDPKLGIEWLRKSAAQGDELGKEYLEKAQNQLREHPQDDGKPLYERH